MRPSRVVNAHYQMAGELIGKHAMSRQLRTLGRDPVGRLAPFPPVLPDRSLRLCRPEALRRRDLGRAEGHQSRSVKLAGDHRPDLQRHTSGGHGPARRNLRGRACGPAGAVRPARRSAVRATSRAGTGRAVGVLNHG